MLEQLKSILGISDSKKDGALIFALNNATDVALNYCNIKKIPKGLETTIIRMAMDLYRLENIGSENIASEIVSIKEGDTASGYQLTGTNEIYSNSLLKDYKTLLNRYRKVSWPQ